jgi:aminoglycoside phosphotransferase (APT) family kinase protein
MFYGGRVEIMAQRSRAYSYRDVRDLIQRSLEACPGFGTRVKVDGKLNRIDEGIWHDNYWFWIRGRELSAGRANEAYVLRLLDQREDWQKGSEPRQRLLREAETLQVLTKSKFTHPTPTFICFVRDDQSETIGMIETGLSGYSLGRFKNRSTLRIVSRVAADVHRLAIKRFSHVPSSDDRTEHVKRRLAELDNALFAEFPFANDVRQWIEAHSPSGDSCVLHGDLLPQNLLCDWPAADQEEAPIGIVDWEMARVGDPAYDLAIVSRGDQKVFGVKNGVKVLVEDYAEFGGQTISLNDVRVHELLLLLQWLWEAWLEYQKPAPRGQGPDYYEAKLRSLFRRSVR